MPAASKERLVGTDGQLVSVTFGEEVTSGALGEQWYRVTGIAASSGIPAAVNVNDLIWGDGITLDPNGDAVEPLEETIQADITSFNIEITRNEIDVTTLTDSTRRYRGGKTDMNGSLEGITSIGDTDNPGWVMNKVMAINRTDAAGAVTVDDVDEAAVYIKGVIQKDVSPGEREAFIWARIFVLGSTIGASGEDAQSFSANFRIAPGEPDPTIYIREIAVPST